MRFRQSVLTFSPPTLGLIQIVFFFLMLTVAVQSSEAFRCAVPLLKKDGAGQHLSVKDRNLRRMPTTVPTAPAHPAAPAHPIGFQRNFFAIDFAKKQQYIIHATLRASGHHCYIFVEDSEWPEKVTAQMVQMLHKAFDTATPADPRRGIYETLTAYLGTPPDIDKNGKVILLLLNIRDAAAHHTTAGYFLPVDQERGMLHHPTFGPLHSNEADILYVHSRNQPGAAEAIQKIIAHELQHLIHYKHSPNEEIWIDEGCADYAAFQCGYNLNQHIAAFQQTPDISLTNWEHKNQANLLSHYGAAFLFMLYLHEHYGGQQTIAALVKSPIDGISGVVHTLEKQGIQRTFSDIFSDWKVANYLTAWRPFGTVEKSFRYNSLTPTILPLFTHDTYPTAGKNKILANFSAHAIECTVRDATVGQAGLTFNFSTQRNAKVDIRAAYLYNTGEIRVESLPLKTETDGMTAYDIPTFGTSVQRVMIMPSLQVENRSFSQQTITYNYDAFEGNLGTYSIYVLPNPIHRDYWEIVVVPSEAVGALSLTLTLTYQNRKVLDAKPMIYVANEAKSVYRCAFHLDTDDIVGLEAVKWHVMRGDTIIDEGVLNQLITDN